jgi:DNA-directed RNA polymerase specialized sigma24 family protein
MPTGVTHWIGLLKAGDVAAAQPLFERYFARLVELARSRLRGARRRVADEEDVALSAFDSFCRGAGAGHFPRLTDSADLWKLLVVITARKAADLRAHEKARKRGGGAERGESALLLPGDDGAVKRGIEEVIGTEPTPEFAAQVAEQCRTLLDALADDTQRSIAVWKMEGFTSKEIAARFNCSLSTVDRKLDLIRSTWKQHGLA